MTQALHKFCYRNESLPPLLHSSMPSWLFFAILLVCISTGSPSALHPCGYHAPHALSTPTPQPQSPSTPEWNSDHKIRLSPSAPRPFSPDCSTTSRCSAVKLRSEGLVAEELSPSDPQPFRSPIRQATSLSAPPHPKPKFDGRGWAPGLRKACIEQQKGKITQGLRGGGLADPDDRFGADDQVVLNRYAGYNHRRKELKSDISQLKEDLESFQDAADEILLMPPQGPPIFSGVPQGPAALMHRFGDTFTNWNPEDANQMIESNIEDCEKRLQLWEEELELIRGRMARIKKSMLSKFGDRIALDPDSEDIGGD